MCHLYSKPHLSASILSVGDIAISISIACSLCQLFFSNKSSFVRSNTSALLLLLKRIRRLEVISHKSIQSCAVGTHEVLFVYTANFSREQDPVSLVSLLPCVSLFCLFSFSIQSSPFYSTHNPLIF